MFCEVMEKKTGSHNSRKHCVQSTRPYAKSHCLTLKDFVMLLVVLHNMKKDSEIRLIWAFYVHSRMVEKLKMPLKKIR